MTTPPPLHVSVVVRVTEQSCETTAGTVGFAPGFPTPHVERVSPGHLVAVAREQVVWRWYDAVVLGPEGDQVRLWEPAHGEVLATPRPSYVPLEPGARAYASAGLPGADWWVCGDPVDLEQVAAFYTERGLWKTLG